MCVDSVNGRSSKPGLIPYREPQGRRYPCLVVDLGTPGTGFPFCISFSMAFFIVSSPARGGGGSPPGPTFAAGGPVSPQPELKATSKTPQVRPRCRALKIGLLGREPLVLGRSVKAGRYV